MKKFINLCITLLFASAVVFCMAACNGGSRQTVTYEIAVDTQNVSVDTSDMKVCVYTLNGTFVKEKYPTGGKAKFELNADNYVVTLGGLNETASFSSVLLTQDSTKVTVEVSDSDYNDLMEYYSYAFTVIFLSGDYSIGDLSAQICDLDLICHNEYFENGNVVDIVTNGGECSVEVFDSEQKEIYNQTFTVDNDKRFYIVRL